MWTYILLGIIVWTIVSVAYTFTNAWKMFTAFPNKTPIWEWIFYPPLLVIAFVIDLIYRIGKKNKD